MSMSKSGKILVVLACLVAAASASAVRCQIYQDVCGSVNGTCDDYTTTNTNTGDISYWSYECPSGTYTDYTSSGSGSTCTCRAFTQVTPVLGATCTTDQQNYIIPKGSYRCTTSQFSSDYGQYKWFGYKKTGDMCSSNYECLPPRYCTDGVCKPKLNRGDVCYNSTVYAISECQVADYCPSSGSSRVCTQRLPEGSVCTDANSCLPYQSCKSNEGSNSTCQTDPRYTIAAGSKATSSVYCQSGIRETVNGTCVDYNTAYSAYLAVDGIRCTDSTNCTAYGSCSCVSSGNNVYKGYCRWARSTPDQLSASWTAYINLQKSYYSMNCESSPAVPLTSDNNYCYVRAGNTVYGSYSVCNGVGSGYQSSFAMVAIVISAVIAMIKAQ